MLRSSILFFSLLAVLFGVGAAHAQQAVRGDFTVLSPEAIPVVQLGQDGKISAKTVVIGGEDVAKVLFDLRRQIMELKEEIAKLKAEKRETAPREPTRRDFEKSEMPKTVSKHEEERMPDATLKAPEATTPKPLVLPSKPRGEAPLTAQETKELGRDYTAACNGVIVLQPIGQNPSRDAAIFVKNAEGKYEVAGRVSLVSPAVVPVKKGAEWFARTQDGGSARVLWISRDNRE
jgi:hypothetical protein